MTWTSPTSLFTGILAVVVCAYLAAVFLTAEAQARKAEDLEAYFRTRSRIAGAVAGAVSVAGLAVVHADARHLFDRLTGPALPFVGLSVLAGVAVLTLIRRVHPKLLRVLAAGAVAALIAGWGVAQYPYLLGDHLSLADAAGPNATLVSVLVIFVAATILVVPSLGVLYWLHERGQLEGA
ncbi:MAG: hypothetical protein NVSMB32_11700 [Actinomycetota bacterium]